MRYVTVTANIHLILYSNTYTFWMDKTRFDSPPELYFEDSAEIFEHAKIQICLAHELLSPTEQKHQELINILNQIQHKEDITFLPFEPMEKMLKQWF